MDAVISFKQSPKIIRSWFDKILNPIIDGLEMSIQLLETNNFTWNRYYKDFVMIKSIDKLFEYKYFPIFEQFIEFSGFKIELFSNEYNKKREHLKNSCNELFDELIRNQKFIDLVKATIEKYSIINELSESNRIYLSGDDTVEWFAGYLINNVQTLDNTSILRNIWDKEKDKFYNILREKEFESIYLEIQKDRNEFEEVAHRILKEFKKYRNQLSLESGEPIME